MRLPFWLAMLIFVPLQVYLAIKLYAAYGLWTALAVLVVIGILSARAARAPWFRAMLFPHWALQWERRRHLFQGILFLGAALAWLLVASEVPRVPLGLHDWLATGYPFLPLAGVVALVKATLR